MEYSNWICTQVYHRAALGVELDFDYWNNLLMNVYTIFDSWWVNSSVLILCKESSVFTSFKIHYWQYNAMALTNKLEWK